MSVDYFLALGGSPQFRESSEERLFLCRVRR